MAFGDPAALRDAERVRRHRSRSRQRLRASHAGAREQTQLPVHGDSRPGARVRGVRARDQPHSGCAQPADVLHRHVSALPEPAREATVERLPLDWREHRVVGVAHQFRHRGVIG